MKDLLQAPPPGFKDHKLIFNFEVPAPSEKVWKWLNDPKTFTDSQIWPYKVEFYSPDPNTIQNGFNEGVLTNHHGPLVNFAGIITKIDTGRYRDLQYTYGSYFLSFRWIRPYRLEFETEEKDGVTYGKGTLSAYIKPSFEKIWSFSQGIFWKRFGKWANRSVLKGR